MKCKRIHLSYDAIWYVLWHSGWSGTWHVSHRYINLLSQFLHFPNCCSDLYYQLYCLSYHCWLNTFFKSIKDCPRTMEDMLNLPTISWNHSHRNWSNEISWPKNLCNFYPFASVASTPRESKGHHRFLERILFPYWETNWSNNQLRHTMMLYIMKISKMFINMLYIFLKLSKAW